MPEEHSPAVPGPDEFDRQLRDLTSGAGGEAALREPSARERARRPAGPAQPARMSWRTARKARKLRKPVSPSGSLPARLTGRGRLRVVGGTASPRRPAPSARRRSLRSVARTTGILVAFAALLVVLHALGFGPR